MRSKSMLRNMVAALALALAACSGSDIASPGATNSGTPPGGGTGGGGAGGGGGGVTCPAGTTAGGGLGANTICNLTGEVITNLTLPRLANVVYRINGRVDVGRDLGGAGNAATGQSATLTIEPGVTLFGQAGSDVLIINRGSRINANGTASQPIIFTSRNDLEGTATATTSRQWAGVIINGRAPIGGCATAVTRGSVDCQNQVEGITASTGSASFYGGATPDDNSGVFRFVQIKFPGAFLPGAAAGDDLNGLTLGGVGTGTLIENVQVHNSGDDGIEVFGGTVNMRNIVVTGALDDSLDFDEGWNGNVQFAVVTQALTVAGGPDRLIESSNRTVAGTGGTLFTNPTLSNFTFVGVRQNDALANLTGITLNNTGGTPGSSGRYRNGIVTGSNTCVNMESSSTVNVPSVSSVLFDCPTGSGGTVTTGIINGGTNNSTAVGNSLTGLLPGPVEQGRTAVNPTTLGAFFTAANYIGAFSPSETVSANWASGWTFGLFPAVTGCPTGTTDTASIVGGQRNCRLSGTLPASVRLVAGNIYQLSGRVDVGTDTGGDPAAPISGRTNGTLTIDAGVRIYGRAAQDMLVVNRGSQIFVNGTRNAPVIMTSEADVTGTQANKSTASREWAGLIINGRAPIRGCNTAVARGSVACQSPVEGVFASTGRDALFGGATAGDNSGRLQFLQIRYPGAFLPGAGAGDDLNGLTLGGVGSGTTIENVQVHNSGDDGIEVFGGTVNMRNIVITGAQDDSFDLDDGWNGKTQFLLIRQTAGSVSDGPDRLVESSNRAVAGVGAGLDTNPLISNFTMIGLPTKANAAVTEGVVLNNTGGTPGSSGRYVNGVVTGSTTCAVASAASPSPAPTFNSILFNCPTAPNTATLALINAGANNTTTEANTLTSVFVNGPTETARPAVDPTTLDPYFVSAPYIGAVRNASDTWWQTWTCGLQTGTVC